jgi:hypothetical protein
MATVFETLARADALTAALQHLIDSPSFSPFRDFLEGLQQQVIGSREALSERHPDGSDEIGDTAAARLDAARQAALSAQPNHASMAKLEARCNAAIAAMDAA